MVKTISTGSTGRYWTIQHRKNNGPWKFSSYESVAGIVYTESREAHDEYGTSGFLTLEQGFQCLTKVQNVVIDDLYEFRLVRVDLSMKVDSPGEKGNNGLV